MGQSLVKNYLHIVFSTKHRKALIYPPYENELYAYLAGSCKKMGCPVLTVGGHVNHVHILCMLSKKIALMHLLQEIKSTSSKWMKTKDESLKNFYWQDGYGAFSVNYKTVDTVVRYIQNQHRHHRRKTFKQEYLEYMEQYQIDYDERYIWL